MDFTKIDQLFILVDIWNDSHYAISRANNTIKQLNRLDLSKIIILAYPKNIVSFGKGYLDKNWISIKEWPVQIIPFHSNFVLANYNFIYTDEFAKIRKYYQKDKITVVLCWYNLFSRLYCQSLKQLHTFVDILISAKPSNFKRILNSEYGIQKVIWDYPDKITKSIQYLRLTDKTVTLH